MTRRRALLVPLAALALAGAAGCGSSDDSASGGGGGDGGAYGSGASSAPKTTAAAPAGGLQLEAVESNGLSFDKKKLSAKAGSVTITMANPSGDSQPHAIALEGPGVSGKSGEIAQPGATSKVTATLRPGTYTFYCPVGAHRQAGMEGTLTVR